MFSTSSSRDHVACHRPSTPTPKSKLGRNDESPQAAQDKEELQRKGDELDDKIRRAEKDREPWGVICVRHTNQEWTISAHPAGA